MGLLCIGAVEIASSVAAKLFGVERIKTENKIIPFAVYWQYFNFIDNYFMCFVNKNYAKRATA